LLCFGSLDTEHKAVPAIRIAAVGDLHCRKSAGGHAFSTALEKVNDVADVLVLCGDLTDHGMADEAHVLVRELSKVSIPMVGVLGNHDFEAGHPEEVAAILEGGGVRVLDGDDVEILGVGFAGAKGFIGGFGRGTLGGWGEPGIKHIVQEAIDEALKLESALSRLRTERRVGILHYAPIRETVEGEPLEIFPYLGCGRLAEPLRRYPVDALFHGHAHHGSLEGQTSGGVPVYNVALPLLRAKFPEGPNFRVIELREPPPQRG
jgi:Icc-related predicted phosphoesterase